MHGADRERGEDADRHVALRVLRLLRGGRDRVEADVGEEHHRRAAQHAAPAELAELAGVRRDERRQVLAPARRPRPATTKTTSTTTLMHDQRRVGVGGLLDADHQQRRDQQHDGGGRQVEHAGSSCRRRPWPSQRGGGELGRERDAEVAQQAHEVARPADRDGRRAERVLEDQVPADDPGDELARRRVGVGVGAARDRDHRRELGVAEAREARSRPPR